MAYSPSRRNISNLPTKRQRFSAQNKQQNYNLTNFSQRSPSIRSPKLNQESQYTKLRDANVLQEVKIKLQTVLKHNSQLLNENATLSQMVNNQRLDFDLRIKKDENQIARARVEMNSVIQEMKQQQRHQDIEINRLLEEISRLHQQNYRVQVQKNNQLKRLQENYEKDMTVQIRNIKKSNEDGKQIYELQVRKLKQAIQLKNFQYESLKSQSKNQNDKLKGQIEDLKNDIKHLNKLKEMQLKEMEEGFKENFTNKIKQLQRESAMTVSKLESKMRKLKQDLINKNIEIQQANRKGTQNQEEHQQELDNLREQRQRLVQEINDIQITSKQTFRREKEKIIQLGELQKHNIEAINENERDCLKGQITKLTTVCFHKNQEIKRLYSTISELKNTYEIQKAEKNSLINNLKERIKLLENDTLEEIQLLKIKMAQLHESDIKNLQKYYTNEIILMAEQNKVLASENQKSREKIHKLLQDNDDMRKTFQVQLTKYKAKVQDYKVKFAAANLEFRQQITSLGTKMDLTSQTLLREAEQKKKGSQFFETQKRKYHALVQSKDKQINTVYETMARLKQLHGGQIKELQQEVIILKETIDEKNKALKEMRSQFEKEFEQKSQKLIKDRSDPDDILSKQNLQLRNKLQVAEKEIFQKKKEVQFSQKEIKSLQQEVGLRAGFLETMQLESSAAIEDQRSKMKIMMNQAEIAMKDYYQARIVSRDKDNSALREQLQEKQSDIRKLIVKYNQLEKRLKQLLDAQGKLSQLETKIMNLGMDQNLIKNVAELFARHQNN